MVGLLVRIKYTNENKQSISQFKVDTSIIQLNTMLHCSGARFAHSLSSENV